MVSFFFLILLEGYRVKGVLAVPLCLVLRLLLKVIGPCSHF